MTTKGTPLATKKMIEELFNDPEFLNYLREQDEKAIESMDNMSDKEIAENFCAEEKYNDDYT